jgi:hypothetical protein
MPLLPDAHVQADLTRHILLDAGVVDGTMSMYSESPPHKATPQIDPTNLG